MFYGSSEKKVFIVRHGEASLKGRNKPYFERMLIERIRKLLRGQSGVEVSREGGLVFVRTDRACQDDEIISGISKVFGVASISPAIEVEADLDAISAAASAFMRDKAEKEGARTFKVEAKRSDKSFPVQSPDIARITGANILRAVESLRVDVNRPDCLLFVNLRKGKAYIYERKIAGFGGLPLGTNGKGLILLSGGIDSPVAAFMMARRGMGIEAVHFHSYPYTGKRALEKTVALAGIVAVYCGRFDMHAVNLLPVQEQLAEKCPEGEMTVLVRRFMMRIAERIAVAAGCGALITGESLGQVASQTAEALAVTDAAAGMPVMRPLIALDKTEIIEKAQAIGTYETSILPYEDCCTVFLPKHPVTKPRLERILASESRLDVEALVAAALESKEVIPIYPGG
ncbi:MAG: tRNA 4-thiouridine(8) synthase ThiI [Clostridiales Family XIII bacterium]|jgi:thiamine biosynthesis protein ThiI|nr:tRNA 4-thiouridine(8) synthase ThiI [Clostridiales Family XIII bacterium]